MGQTARDVDHQCTIQDRGVCSFRILDVTIDTMSYIHDTVGIISVTIHIST